MCGRFDHHSEPVDIAKAFRVDHIAVADYKPSYNIAPAQNIVIIKDDGMRHLVQCLWGFIPSWARDTKCNPMINARAETVAEKAAFKDAFRNHRCLVIADGFYEWMPAGRVKKPVYVRLKSRAPFGMAGLYSIRRSPEGEEICTCAIITTDANDLLMPVHDRMPVIIPREREDIWLDPKTIDKDKLMPLLVSYPSDLMECYEVSAAVNKTEFDSADVIIPVVK